MFFWPGGAQAVLFDTADHMTFVQRTFTAFRVPREKSYRLDVTGAEAMAETTAESHL